MEINKVKIVSYLLFIVLGILFIGSVNASYICDVPTAGSSQINLSIHQPSQSHQPDYLACWEDDVYWFYDYSRTFYYWFDMHGQRKEKYQECGSDRWTDNYRCSGDYVQREKIERGCRNASCYEESFWEDYRDCGDRGEVCDNGQCVEEEEDYLDCWNDDVYWFDGDGDRESKYQDCGSDYCNNWSSTYCSGGDVYKKRTCYNKGCSDDSCYSNSYTDRDLVERCDSDEICSGGECVRECECSSGSCCDGCHYKSSSTICDVETQSQYGCPWGTGCGSDVGERKKSKFKYCSGDNSQCNGNWGNWTSWASWQITDSCSTSEVCRIGNSACQYNSNCVYSPPSYYKYSNRRCYDDDLYWYDSNGLKQDKYQECLDDNACTADGCENNACFNNLRCDGSTCDLGTEDYCQNCEHCGDEACNCQEDKCSCSEDCSAVIISAFGKISDMTEWKTSLASKTGEELSFLFVVVNSGAEIAEDVFVKAEIPSGIDYKNELKIDGDSISGDIRKGIEIDSIEPDVVKTITFKGKAGETGEGAELLGKVEAKGLSSTDSVVLTFGEKGQEEKQGIAAAGLLFLKYLAKRWYIWLLAGLAIFSIIWVLRKGS